MKTVKKIPASLLSQFLWNKSGANSTSDRRQTTVFSFFIYYKRIVMNSISRIPKLVPALHHVYSRSAQEADPDMAQIWCYLSVNHEDARLTSDQSIQALPKSNES